MATESSQPALPYGVEFGYDDFFPGWRFAAEPDLVVLEKIARHHLGLPCPDRCTVSFLAEGGFNKVYKVETAANLYVFKVALPLELPVKVESEVATMTYIRDHTNVPVPHIYSFDSTNENELRFPWILMDYVSGRPLKKQWKNISMDKKVELVKQFVNFHSQLFNVKFDRIGSLHLERQIASRLCSNPYECDNQTLGQIVSMDFTLAEPTAPRGPFATAREWVGTLLSDAKERQERAALRLKQQDLDDAFPAKWARFSTRLLNLVPRTFPESAQSCATVLHPHDLSDSNIFVDEAGNLTGVIDLEFVAAVPEWNACQPPGFLAPWKRRKGPPARRRYPARDDDTPEEIEDGVSRSYWEHLEDWEKMQLQDMFFVEIERSQPGWRRQFEEGKDKRQFLQLVNSAQTNDMFDPREDTWLDRYEKGESTASVFSNENSHDWESSWLSCMEEDDPEDYPSPHAEE